MNNLRKIIISFAVTSVMIVFAVITEKLYFSDYEYHLKTRFFNKTLAEKEAIMESCLADMEQIISDTLHIDSDFEKNIFETAEKNNITILKYLDERLVFWSNADFDVPRFLIDSLYNRSPIFFQNGWFLSKTIQSDNEVIVALLRIRTEHGFTNDIIQNGFEKEFRLSQNVDFSFDKEASEYQIADSKGNFLFSLLFPQSKEISYLITIPLVFWTLSFIFLIWFIIVVTRYFAKTKSKYLSTIISLVFSVSCYSTLLLTKQPQILSLTDLFSPYRFSLNSFLPSLGHLLILSFFAALTSYTFLRDFPDFTKEKKTAFVIKAVYIFLAAVLFAIFHYLFCQLISTSNINFESYKVLEISQYSIIGFAALLLLLVPPYFFILKAFRTNSESNAWELIIFSIIMLPVFYLFFHHNLNNFILISLFWIIFIVIIWTELKHTYGRFSISVLFALIIGLYSLHFITILSQEKTSENLKIKAVSFSTENDPEAEHLLLDIWPEISSDIMLQEMMLSDRFNTNAEDFDRISTYISETYLKGYLGNYNFNIVLCSDREMLRVGTDRVFFENCFDFFNSRIQANGQKLTGTEFYFIDNQAGRTHYLGQLFYKTNRGATNGLFIELYSDINIFQPGYSELLLDKKYHKYAGLKDYSFAKYINGEIALRTGDCPYYKTDADYIDNFSDYRVFNSEGYNHVLYKNDNSTVIISRPELKPGDLLISFAYLYAFILIFLNILSLSVKMPSFRRPKSLNFRQKLQLSYIGILLFSFIMIGVVISMLTIGEYTERHNENIKEKLNSVYYELENWLGNETILSADWRNTAYSSLNEFLIDLSNTFNTDINVYDLNGYLIATSRQEIFYRNLISRRINNRAFVNMKDFTRSEYYQQEKIGKLEYISAYIPFYNSSDEVLAYLNLPYFRMQNVLAKEISDLVAVIINFTFLLIVIVMSITVFLSRRLTSPLSLLSERLASVGVGRKSEHLLYESDDEIGDLVRQYNRMVDEIEESAKKLAFSEREYAWREMAKQIAHEIKNPLTPMKLNVQQLLKSWKDQAPEFDARIESFSKNQIEYIDNLSTIATAFSSFAKMPGNNPSDVDLIEQIRSSHELYKNTENVTFNVSWPKENKVMVYADKEQLNGVFSNLIKNAIQSIPAGKSGIIKIGLEIKGNRAIVQVSDNGTGVPEALREKMFAPNFTTKSSGMGLGLSIAKRYIENAGGNIWFESQEGVGTSFFIGFPIKYTIEK